MLKKFKLTELREGGEIGTEKIGTLEEIVDFLKENEELYMWIWTDDDGFNPITTKKPNFKEIETLRELKYELKKIDLSWWSLEIEEI